MIGGVGVLSFYFMLLMRILVTAKKAGTVFGTLLVISIGIPIIFQAFINIGVALQVLPVTGQNLPMISSGGTSAWMTCIAMGIILSVSVKREISAEIQGKEGISSNPISIFSESH